jgi:dTMP kinase
MVLVAIVGCDGAGKSSAVQLLRTELSREFRVKQIDKWNVLDSATFPEYRFMIPDLPTLRRCVSDMPEVTRTLFVFWTLHGTLTPKATAGADIVLLDGYWPKHAASEILYSGRRELVEMLSAIMPTPDLTLFLDVDPAVAYRRRSADKTTPLVPYECGLDQTCSEAGFMCHQKATRKILTEWCETFNWTRIDANAEQTTVADAIFAATRCMMRNVSRRPSHDRCVPR